jgi:hypothetical protein
MTDRELMQMALNALESCTEDESYDGDMVFWYDEDKVEDVRKALRDRLAQPAPQKREWVSLTDEEIKEIVGPWGETPVKGYTRKLFDQIEAKLKEKNI